MRSVAGSSFSDVIKGNHKRNRFFGWQGDDELHGRGGDDSLSGYEGDDSLNGGNGDDSLNGDDGENVNDGGNGTDVCRRPNPSQGALNCEKP